MIELEAARSPEPEPVSSKLADEYFKALLSSRETRPQPATFDWNGPTIYYTELPPANPNGPSPQDWETFRQEIGRLLAEGHEGRHVLIHAGKIIGIWDTYHRALAEGQRLFPFQPIAVQRIAEWQPLYRISDRLTWAG